jgi:hypothetical protein
MIYYFINSNSRFNYITDLDNEKIEIKVLINNNIIYSKILNIKKNTLYFTETNNKIDNKIVIIKSFNDNNILKFELTNNNFENDKKYNENNNILKKMIVITTHNGDYMLLNLLNDINKFNIKNNEICIVDNISTDEKHLEKLIFLEKLGYNILYNKNDSYEIGAFKIAYENFKSDIWVLLQDSIRIKEDVFNMIIPYLTNSNIYTFLTFYFPNLINQEFVYKKLYEQFNNNNLTFKKGIFGNMFFCKNNIAELIYKSIDIPNSKNDSKTTEISLSILMEKNNININGLDILDNRADFINGFDTYSFFSKIMMNKNR